MNDICRLYDNRKLDDAVIFGELLLYPLWRPMQLSSSVPVDCMYTLKKQRGRSCSFTVLSGGVCSCYDA